MPTQGLPLAPKAPSARSRVTNHRDVLPDVDGRSPVAGAAATSYPRSYPTRAGLTAWRVQLVRRFAACAVLAEAMEARMVNGEALDIAEYSTLTSTLVRVAQRIGISRVARDVTPSLHDYIAAAEVEA